MELRRGADIAERLLGVGVGCIALSGKMSRDAVGRHVSLQLVRSATAAGANYEEARAAESRADFVHKVRVAAKEMREAIYWLRVTMRASLSSTEPRVIEALVGESNELVAILLASGRTASAVR